MHAATLSGRGQPTLAFFPATGDASDLLRIDLIARGLRRCGWRCIVVPPQLTLAQRIRALRAAGPDLCIVKGARHPLNRASAFAGHRVVVDLDDADFHDPALEPALVELARGSAGFIAGSDYTAAWATRLGAAPRVIWTSCPPLERPRPPHAQRRPIIAWAQADPLTYPRERAFVADVLRRMLNRHPHIHLRLYGRRKGEPLSAFPEFAHDAITVDWQPAMRFPKFLESLRDVSIGLSPALHESAFSRGKSFGKILGYLEAKVPVICSDEGEHRRFFRSETGIVSNDPDVWRDAILHLLGNAPARQQMADAAFRDFEQHLSTGVAVAQTDRYLRHVLDGIR